MLHNNSNASKKSKLTGEQAAAAASNVATAQVDRQYASAQRGDTAFDPNGTANVAGVAIGRSKARITGKLNGVDNECDISNLNGDQMPISPDSSVNDRFNNFQNFRSQNNGSNLNNELELQHQINKGLDQYLNPQTAGPAPQINTLNINNFKPKNIKSDGSVSPSTKQGHPSSSLEGTTANGTAAIFKTQQAQNNANTLSTNSINEVVTNAVHGGQNGAVNGVVIQQNNNGNQGFTNHASTSDQNLNDHATQMALRKKRNRSNNQSILESNQLTQDITLLSPMGVFDEAIDENNNNNINERDQSTSFDGALSKSTMNRKDRRTGFFQRKELQLHTTIRKGKTTGQNTYILSPDQVKFTQENLQHRFEEEDNDIILNLNNSSAATMASKRRVTGVATADQGIGTAATVARSKATPDEIAGNMSMHSEQQAIIGNTASIVSMSHPHRKNSQSRTLHRNLDSDMRQANQNYDQKTKSMLTNGPNQQNDIGMFLQNNYGSFKSVHGANATVGNADLKGIGQLAAELAQSQDTQKIVRGLSQHNQQHANSNSHPAAHRKIESSFNANSYINNSSVAKTSMQKRRNISFGATGNNNYINDQQQRPSIIDLESSMGSTNRISRPNINNTYDGSSQHKMRSSETTNNATPSNKYNMNGPSAGAATTKGAICSNDSAFSNRNSRDYRNIKKNNYNDANIKSAPQPSHKYQPQGPQQSSYIDELLLNSTSQQNQVVGPKQVVASGVNKQGAPSQKAYETAPSKVGKAGANGAVTNTGGVPGTAVGSNQRNRHSSDRSIQEIQAYYSSKRRGGAANEETTTGGGTVAWEEQRDKVGKYGQFGPGQRGPADGAAIEAQFGGAGMHGQEIDEFSQIIFRQDCNKNYQWESEMAPGSSNGGAKRTSEVEDKGQLLRRMGSQAAQTASYALGPDPQGAATNTNIHDANNSYLLQKQMNSSRFGGFRTADGASQGNKIHHLNYLNHQIGGADEAAGAGNIGFIGLHPGPQSPESNQSFRIYVENRRARPKIVKTSHDHGNIFFAQQANSLKNSSQIGQRKDLASKMLPYQVLQSRGGDISSLGGITSATTAFGNNDGISQENRSGYHEIPGHNGANANNNYSYSGNGIFVGDQSHKSISDKERTPTHGQEPKQFLKMNNNNKKETNASIAAAEDDEAHNTNSGEGKGKNPYYFTFFNEKNEQQQQNNNGGPEAAGEPQQPQNAFDPHGKQDQQNQSNQQAQMFTLNYHQTLDQDTRRINYPIRGNHHASATQNQSVSMQNQRESELNNKSRIQKRQLIEPEPTPSFISQKQARANAQSKPKSKEGSSITQSNSYIRKRMSQNRAMISSHNGFSQDGGNGSNNNMDNSNVSRLMDISNNSALNDSVLSGHRDPSTGNQPNAQESMQPSYTPVRRNPGQTYQRTKPQSPKILLPQCFLDQPLNQILQNNGTSATNANQKSNPRDQLGSKLEQRGGSSILSANNQNKMSLMKAKIGEIQPPQLNNVVGPNGSNFGSTLGTGIGKVTPVGNIGQLRDKNASTKMEEPRSLPVGELDLRHDDKNQKVQALKIMPKYKTDGSMPASYDMAQDHSMLE